MIGFSEALKYLISVIILVKESKSFVDTFRYFTFAVYMYLIFLLDADDVFRRIVAYGSRLF